ncbi:hypothetical protein AWV80_23405 [Cupriavidus sp. UYMU48A]|nr:hypothetical protein AWV80_23405 [Cupriavidus sp. UYMU48A]
MYVILDSNIYCQDYFGRSASFKFLVHFLNNSGYSLLLPRLVIQEVANVRARKVKEELDVVRKALEAVGKMSELPLPSLSAAIETEPYNLHKLISTS